MNSTVRIKNKQSFEDHPLLQSVATDPARHDMTDVANTTYKGCVIDQSYILGQLRHEIQRTQRSGYPLSILILTQNNFNENNTESISDMLKALHLEIRETDIAGYIDQYNLSVLLPYTNEQGADKIREKLLHRFLNPQFSITKSTYPDRLFDSLINFGCVSSIEPKFDYPSKNQ